MIRTLCFVGAAAAFLLTTACMTPSQQMAALQALDAVRESGGLTDAQFEELRRSILEAGTANFWQQFVGNATSVSLSLLGVRATRGPSATKDERQQRRVARKNRQR